MARRDGVMRAWQTHTYGQPLDVLTLDEVAIPDPTPAKCVSGSKPFLSMAMSSNGSLGGT